MNEAAQTRAVAFLKLIQEMGWNQSETARQLGVSSNHICMIANGKAAPSKALLQHLRLKVERFPVGDGLSELNQMLEKVPAAQRPIALKVMKGALLPFVVENR